MADTTHILSTFTPTGGTLTTDANSVLAIGQGEGKFRAYEMLLGALSHCVFSTFESIAEKMQFSYEKVDLDITGVKRDEKVALLKTVAINITASGVDDQQKFSKAFEIATRYCSIFQTLSHVAKMSWEISFL
ncbi:MAG: OsmC family protein [Sphaerochaetaceae bacterium]|jgi:putative redox protein